jgi:hypothetical protein
MSRSVFRHHYEFDLPEHKDRVADRVRSQMRRNNPADLKLRRIGSALILRFPSHTSQAVTPQMELRLTELSGGGTSIHAVIGPSFGMWKFVRAALLSCVLIAGIGILLAMLEWQTGGIAWGPYLVLLGLAGWLFLFFMIEEAKRRNKDHTELLKVFIDNALGYDCFQTDKARGMSREVAHRTT